VKECEGKECEEKECEKEKDGAEKTLGVLLLFLIIIA